MTFLDRLAVERPDMVGNNGNVVGCPKHYWSNVSAPCVSMSCYKCWNREIPTEENTGTCKYHEPFNGICCNGDCKPCVADSVDPETTCRVCKFFEEGVFKCTE